MAGLVTLDRELVVDGFAGGGGASLGIEQAVRRPVDIAINHDRKAIAMHEANHPRTRHYQTDIHNVDPEAATQGVPVGFAWFSPDCTHHSRARGGKPVEKGIRDLAWVVVRWAQAVRPRVIIVENVEEFLGWGPIDEHNKPIKSRAGETFRSWVNSLKGQGYTVDWRTLWAHEYGAPTKRKRIFVVARRDGLPIVWPEVTHGEPTLLEPGLLPYRTAAECLDWWLPCPSIFLTREEARELRRATGIDCRRPLVDATMRRIANGVRRYVIDASEPFIVRTGHYSNLTGEGAGFRGQGTGQPLATVTSINDYGLVMPFVANLTHQGGDRVESLTEPWRTITGAHRGEKALVAAHMTTIDNQSSRNGSSAASAPLATTVTENRHALVTAFLAGHGGRMGQSPERSVEAPYHTITAKADTGLIASTMVKLYGTDRSGAPVTQPMPTISAQGQHLGEVRAFLAKYYGNDKHGASLRDPMHTITSKERMGLVTVYGEPYQIIDIGQRMLQARELFRAQGFPEEYVIEPIVDGKPLTKTDQVAMCGNSVVPQVARALVEANVVALGQSHLWRGYETAGLEAAG